MRRRGRPDRLSALDMINLAVETPAAPTTIGALLILDGQALRGADGALAIAAIRRDIARGLATAPPLRRVLRPAGPLAGRPVWVDDPAFDVERHVSVAEVPHPGDEAALLRLASRLTSGVLDRSYPLWRLWFVTGLAGGEVAVVVKLHHVLADGLGAVRLILSAIDASSVDGHDPPRPSPSWSWRDLVLDNARERLAGLRRPPHWSTWRALAAQRRTLSTLRHAARTSLNAPVGPRRRLAVLRIDLAAAKRVAHRHDGKVNDVVLSLATAGVRSLLAARGEPVEGLRLHCTVAMSQPARGGAAMSQPARDGTAPDGAAWNRTAPDGAERGGAAPGGAAPDGAAWEGAAWEGAAPDGAGQGAAAPDGAGQGAAARGGNHTGGVVVRLPAGEPDPGVRLRLVAAESARAKREQPPTAGNALLVWLARLGVAGWFSRHQHLIHFVESNLPGPPAPVRVLGAPLLDVVPIGNLAGNLGVSFLALSYAGRLVVTVHADADRFPDLPVLLAGMRREWAALSADL
ncbi:wax ester/triacylglycerol synthase domain-containing protein [Phytohabitans suffuscus]|uniref:diacylglycerol O-acyltransferase n=1 Tax=Phytohabitans suffuscus TaxID=624315 RepID=A0A6F8Z0K1_9ACTN|nr:wax ester/triacylglycerol synthase domain-containing protein [Phytohabitans suffuscus]BCB91846.1 hypothetical protein Psuf_091590 [Phytohabitans suffuscus]